MLIPRWILIDAVAAALAAFCVAALIIMVQLGVRRRDNDPQHVHVGEVPRTGGGAIFCGILIGVLVAGIRFPDHIGLVWALMVAAIPIFGAGLGEDFTGGVAPRWRYYASLASATIAFVLADARLVRLDIPILDYWLSYDALCFTLTLFCVAGVAQAYNIVDGKNGLASGSALIFFSVVGLVLWHRGDVSMSIISVACAGSAAGFLFLNYPRGLIFLGDGGAYILGFYVAIISVLLVARHPEISAWFPLLLSAYPIMETIVSITRRLLFERVSFDAPDHLHMHSLIYRRILQMPSMQSRPSWLANSLASLPFLMAAISVSMLGVIYIENTPALQLASLVLGMVYVLFYLGLRRQITVLEGPA